MPYFFARLSAILSGIQLEICARTDILFFCGFMLSPMVAGKLPLRWHESAFFQVLRKIMGWLCNGSVIFPNDSLFPELKNSLEQIVLENERICEFDLDISNLVVDTNRYKLLFYLSSEHQIRYELRINSYSPIYYAPAGSSSGFRGSFDYFLPDARQPLHITLKARPLDEKTLDHASNDLSFRIEKILLLEE